MECLRIAISGHSGPLRKLARVPGSSHVRKRACFGVLIIDGIPRTDPRSFIKLGGN
jgi:hypothetical protein